MALTQEQIDRIALDLYNKFIKAPEAYSEGDFTGSADYVLSGELETDFVDATKDIEGVSSQDYESVEDKFLELTTTEPARRWKEEGIKVFPHIEYLNSQTHIFPNILADDIYGGLYQAFNGDRAKMAESIKTMTPEEFMIKLIALRPVSLPGNVGTAEWLDLSISKAALARLKALVEPRAIPRAAVAGILLVGAAAIGYHIHNRSKRQY